MVVLLSVIAVLFSLFLALYCYKSVKKKSEGSDRMKEIAFIIRSGASEFLKCEYKVLFVTSVAVFAVLAIFVSPSGAFCFLLGAFMSALAGLVGMKSATEAGVRVTETARETRDTGETLSVALKGGAVMGLSVGGFAMLGITVVYLVFGLALGQLEAERIAFHSNFLGIGDIPFTMSVSCYALGCSLIAMINRVGGGIYTKAADMGADLVGKSEQGIPEDDPRNPASIADNVGDNVGDVAGLGSDLLESYVGAMISSVVLAIYTYYSKTGSDDPIGYGAMQKIVAYPIMFASIGLIASSIALTLFFIKKKHGNPKRSLNSVSYIAAFLIILFNVFFSLMYFDRSECASLGFRLGRLSPALSSVLGMVAGILIGQIAEYYTSYDYSPTRRVAKASCEGAALTITEGLGAGMSSTLLPLIVLAMAIMTANAISGLYGVGIAALGMLSFVSVTVSVDTYGPIADNAGGIAEMCALDEDVRNITDGLDAVGNTTAAIGKGFAIGSAAFAALSLFASYLYAESGEGSSSGLMLVLNMLDPLVLAGALVGGALPYMFSGILISSVSKTARLMVEEIRRQFSKEPGILAGTVKPDYNRCIAISSQGALKEVRKPAFIAVATPLIAGFLFGSSFVGGLLIGTTLSAIMLAIFTANSGGAWDNGKKYIEKGNFGGKNTDAHNASIIGDTVGDPLKDTVGPSLDILIKIMSVVSLITVSIFSKYNIAALF